MHVQCWRFGESPGKQNPESGVSVTEDWAKSWQALSNIKEIQGCLPNQRESHKGKDLCL